MEEKHTLEQLRALSSVERKRLVQGIYAGPDHPLFQLIKGAFLDDYPQCHGARVFCGMGSGLGPYNAITITTKKGTRIFGLPSDYLGLPIVRKSE